MERIADAFFADLFFYLFDTAEFDACDTLGFARWHTRANVFLGQHFEVGMNLLVEIYLHTKRGKKISQETSNFHKKLHAEPPTTPPKLYATERLT